MDASVFFQAVQHGLTSGEWESLDEWHMDLLEVTFDQCIFDYILCLLQDDLFLEADNSYKVVILFEFYWKKLSDEQQQKLLPVLKEAFPRFADWMSCFVTSELLGRYYANSESLEVLQQLIKFSSENSRSLIPMGLDYIVRKSSDHKTARDAYNSLVGMQDDPSVVVRDEVELSMKRVERYLNNSLFKT